MDRDKLQSIRRQFFLRRDCRRMFQEESNLGDIHVVWFARNRWKRGFLSKYSKGMFLKNLLLSKSSKGIFFCGNSFRSLRSESFLKSPAGEGFERSSF